MHDPLLLAAVRNNADWCDAVCRARGIARRFTERLWINERATPPYYPNIIMLRSTSEALMRELGDTIVRVRGAVGDQISIKDSCADVDLAPFGLRVLFDAQWIGRRATLAAPPSSVAGVEWTSVRDEGGLDAWKTAWDREILAVDPIFSPDLLDNTDVAFIAGRRGGVIVAGAIVNKSAGAVGLSNVFALTEDARAFRAGCVAAAMAWAPGMPIVGYESGDALGAALELGFEPLGPLRVWVATSAEHSS